ncbi:potassium/proton antiporter [Bacillus tianshenii]|nr:potassium/proton antiporter [Bacillus tianshenii]
MENQLENINYFILLFATLLILGVLTTKFSTRLGVPSLVLFIGIGMVMGSDGLGIIDFKNANLAQTVGIFALIIIIFEGGLQTDWSTVKPVVRPSFSLATLGVLLTTSIVGIASKLIFDVSWYEAFLFGCIIGSTDAAAVFSVLKGHNLRSKLSATLEVESGTNDPMAMFLTITFIQLIIAETTSSFLMLGIFFWQIGIGILAGLVFGKAASYAINQVNLDSSGLYPVFTLAFAILTYSATSMINASGLLAVYISALFIGNCDLTYRRSIFRFNEGFAWMMQILMFAILGLLVFPSELFQLSIMLKGVFLACILMFVARPVAVFLTTMFFKYEIREKIFLSWAGLRGAVPIVLATFPMIADLEHSQLFFNVVFFVVLTSALIQGASIPFIIRKLGLEGREPISTPHSLELVSIGKANAEIIEFYVTNESELTGNNLKEINFPDNAVVNAIIREDELIPPQGCSKIKAGDILYILTSKHNKEDLKRFLRRRKIYKPEQI